MNSSNPVFKNRATATTQSDLENLYNSPSASARQMRRLTMEDVIVRTGLLYAIVLISGAIAWIGNLNSGVILISLFAGMGLGFYNSFARKVHPATIIAYAIFEGLFLGSVSKVYESYYQGIVGQAVLVTAVTYFGVLALYGSKKIRVTPKMYKIAYISLFAYLGIALISFFLSLAGVGDGYGFYHVRGLALLISTFGVALAAFMILLDFDQAQKLVNAGAPESESWRIGFGLTVTLVWLYLQILQLLSDLRNR
jgi:uncharacterized YccA/Bax inhibitor family protein